MPSTSSIQLPKPRSWDEFEELTLAACKLKWNSPGLTRHGRQGQAQQGVDIYGQDNLGRQIGVQCKNTIATITTSIVDDEIKNAEGFAPAIKSLYIATSADSDTPLQKYVRELSQKRIQNGKFSVDIIFWGDVVHDLTKNIEEVRRFYPQFFVQNSYPNSSTLQAPQQARLSEATTAQTQRARDVKSLIDLLQQVDVESVTTYLEGAPKFIDGRLLDESDFICQYFSNPALHYFDSTLDEKVRRWASLWMEIVSLARQAPYNLLPNNRLCFYMPMDWVEPQYADIYAEIDNKTSELIMVNSELCQWINKNYLEVDLNATSARARRFWSN